MLVSDEPCGRAEIAGVDRNRVERRMLDRGDTGIGSVVLVAEVSLVGVAAAAELRIDPLARGSVEPFHRRVETAGVDAEHGCERPDRRC